MKRYILITLIIVLTIIALALSIIYYSRSSSEPEPVTNEENKEPEVILFTSEEGKFELSYPAGWIEVPSLQREGLVTLRLDAPPKDTSVPILASLTVFSLNMEGIEAFFNDEMEKTIKGLEDMGMLISQSQKTIAGLNAVELTYIDNPDDPDKKQLHYFIDAGNIWYQILYTARQSGFDSYLPEVEEIIASFKIIR